MLWLALGLGPLLSRFSAVVCLPLQSIVFRCGRSILHIAAFHCHCLDGIILLRDIVDCCFFAFPLL